MSEPPLVGLAATVEGSLQPLIVAVPAAFIDLRGIVERNLGNQQARETAGVRKGLFLIRITNRLRLSRE